MSPEETGRQLAEHYRNEHGLGVAPVLDMVELLETTHDVHVAVLAMSGIEAMTRRDPRTGRMVIAVAASDNPERQRFSLAHELGHIRAHDFAQDLGLVHLDEAIESKAHGFARHLLAPLDGVRALVERARGGNEQAVADVVRHYRVSPTVATIQLCGIGHFAPEEGAVLAGNDSEWYSRRYGWDVERRDLVNAARHIRPPRRILAASIAGYQQGLVGASIIARLKSQTKETTETEFEDRRAPAAEQASPVETEEKLGW